MAKDDFPIEAGHILMFARALGDANPIYSDAEYARTTEAGSIIAPPTFMQAGSQFLDASTSRPTIGKRWHGSGKEPTGSNAPPEPSDGTLPAGAAGRLHAEQHFEYHLPVTPGMVLHRRTRPGKTWEREGRRGGKLSFAETITEYLDEADRLVVTSRSVVAWTERPPDQAGTAGGGR